MNDADSLRATAADLDEDYPKMEQWARRRASRLGLTLAQMRERDVLRVADSNYPTPVCLDATEIGTLYSSELGEAQLAHLDECPMCAALVDAANPPLRWFDDELAPLIEQTAKGAASGAPQSQLLRPVVTGAVSVIAFACVLATYVFSRHDALLSVLLRDKALEMILAVAVCTTALFVVAIIAKRWVFSPRARWTGGTGIVVVFSMVVAVLFARDYVGVLDQYEQMTSAQASLMERLLVLQRNGTYAATLSENAPGALPGRVLAVRNDEGFDLVWEKTGKRADQLAKIYSGKLRRVNNGMDQVLTMTKNISISADVADSQMTDGDRVMALVPGKTMNVSKIFSVEQGQR